MKRRPIDIHVHDLHFDIYLNGRIMAHSENYASAAKARRAARALIDAINTRPMRLIFWMGRVGSMKRYVVPVRRLWTNSKGQPTAMPVEEPE